MTRAKKPSIKKKVQDRRQVTPLDSEDEAGAYAPRKSENDTGESDDGVLISSPGGNNNEAEQTNS